MIRKIQIEQKYKWTYMPAVNRWQKGVSTSVDISHIEFIDEDYWVVTVDKTEKRWFKPNQTTTDTVLVVPVSFLDKWYGNRDYCMDWCAEHWSQKYSSESGY